MSRLVTKVEGGFIVDVGDNYPCFQRDSVPEHPVNNEDVILALCEAVDRMQSLLIETLPLVERSEVNVYPESLSMRIRRIVD